MIEGDLLLKLLLGGVGGMARSIFHYIKKVKAKETVEFDIGKFLWSAGRGLAGAALLGATKTTTNPIVLITAGLSADVLGKDFWNYILAYFKNK